MRGIRRRLRQSFAEFFALESAGGLVLIGATLVALVIANSPVSAQFASLWSQKIGADLGSVHLNLTLAHWINDGLMAVFFLVVGLEIKRELLVGELSNRQRASFPIAAALGGMIVPAMIYVAITLGSPEVRAWGVPMATDIAFSLGVLALLGSRVPTPLKVFLAALAIVDDIGAVLVIAIFYSSGIDWAWLGTGIGITAVLGLINRIGVKSLVPYLFGGAVIWVCLLQSGVHATIAGILTAFTIPALSKNPDELSPLERLEHMLHPIQTYGIVPLFALANAGVSLSGIRVSDLATGAPLGIMLGLVIGKPIGILAFCWVAVKTKIAELPTSTTWRQISGAGLLAGVGFTMSLFIAELAFPQGAVLIQAKLGILVASILSAVAGYAWLRKKSNSEVRN